MQYFKHDRYYIDEPKKPYTYQKKGRQVKPIYQYTKDGELVKKWGSALEAAAKLNTMPQNLYDAANGKTKQAAGYVWSYEEIINN